MSTWLQGWRGHTGTYDLFQQAVRRGCTVAKALAKHMVDACHC